VTLTIPGEALAAIREHAASAEPGFEVVGRLVVADDRVVAYHELVNRAKQPGRFRVAAAWRRDERSIIVHSHPPPGTAAPSGLDLAWAAREPRREVFAIYCVAGDELAFWRLDPGRESASRLPVLVEVEG